MGMIGVMAFDRVANGERGFLNNYFLFKIPLLEHYQKPKSKRSPPR
jgi:hypothetical protein